MLRVRKHQLVSLVAALAVALAIVGGIAQDVSAAQTPPTNVAHRPGGDELRTSGVVWCRNC